MGTGGEDMTISQLIKELETVKDLHGDVQVYTSERGYDEHVNWVCIPYVPADQEPERVYINYIV